MTEEERVSVEMQIDAGTLTLFFDAADAWSGDGELLEVRLMPTRGGTLATTELMPELLFHLQCARAKLALARGDDTGAIRALREVNAPRRGLTDHFLRTVAGPPPARRHLEASRIPPRRWDSYRKLVDEDSLTVGDGGTATRIPATERRRAMTGSTGSDIAVLIPTLGRAERLADLVDNVHAATAAAHRVYLIMERDDFASIGAAKSLDAISIVGEFGSCAAAVNEGYRVSVEPFFAVANDDVRFHDGWDTAALARFNANVQIVGLNDSSGDCKCFSIARRSYIEKHSGVFDRPNTVYHEYTSQCCDTEFAFFAQLRGVWADARDAVLEHEHWRFGKADADHPNYVKARQSNDADLAIYAQRRAQWDPDGVTPMAVPGAPA